MSNTAAFTGHKHIAVTSRGNRFLRQLWMAGLRDKRPAVSRCYENWMMRTGCSVENGNLPN